MNLARPLSPPSLDRGQDIVNLLPHDFGPARLDGFKGMARHRAHRATLTFIGYRDEAFDNTKFSGVVLRGRGGGAGFGGLFTHRDGIYHGCLPSCPLAFRSFV